jgi:hypothetical protein
LVLVPILTCGRATECHHTAHQTFVALLVEFHFEGLQIDPSKFYDINVTFLIYCRALDDFADWKVFSQDGQLSCIKWWHKSGRFMGGFNAQPHLLDLLLPRLNDSSSSS